MALSKEQYDNIMLQYSQTRDRHRHELERRRHLVYAKIPEYKELEDRIPDLGLERLRSALFSAPAKSPQDEGDSTARSTSTASESGSRSIDRPGSVSFKDQIRKVSDEKRALLMRAGFPGDYLEPQYDCPDCHDTGYIGSQKCHCLRAREIEILYDQSHLKDLIRQQNFRTLSEQWYQGEDLQRFRKAVQVSRTFINNFRQDYENLYFYGTVGTGKSFLSICIAEQILNLGAPVLYFSASALFDRISSYVFGRARAEYQSFLDDLYGCDLLIIDDLGTEMTNSFVSAQLFSLLNERHLNRKSTIISTNLSLEELQDRYSDRIFSRITSNYTVCKLTGPDIRVLKKVRRNGTYKTS